jgi:hypothetical protein
MLQCFVSTISRNIGFHSTNSDCVIADASVYTRSSEQPVISYVYSSLGPAIRIDYCEKD